MPVQPFGKAEAQYDALRVFSQQALEAGAGDGTTGGGVLENKIYLWPADGSTIATYDPTEAGIDLVIAAAGATPGTIWLPSIEITCTSQKSIPANTAVKGLSHKSILSFSGFSDPALVLSAGSIIQDFTLNHLDGQWFDASAEDSKALRIHGTAERAIVGTAIDAEPWFATESDIFWLDRAVNDWHIITPGLGTIGNFYVRADASMAFVYIHSAGWYKGVNLKTSPAWTQISTEPVGGPDNVLRHGSCDGTNLYVVEPDDYSAGDWKHGVYDGSSWTYSGVYHVSWFSPDATAKTFACLWDTVHSDAGTLLESGVFDYRDATDGWVNSGSTRFVWGLKNSNSHIILRNPGVGDLVDIGAGSLSDLGGCFVRGALSGLHVYAIDKNGLLHYSTDGASFSSVATWDTGIANDTLSAGGGDLVWVLQNILDGTTPARLYAVGAWSYTDLTYNFWSLTTGNQTVVGMGMVYG